MIQCAERHGFQLQENELSIALEFYLQIDVDIFNLNTCSFRGAQCTTKSIFCNSTNGKIQGRYGIKRCSRTDCLCCHSFFCRQEPGLQRSAVQFIPKQIHCFVHGYKAVLNCPITCRTSNIIYALTCPCGEFDYVAHTNLSLVDCLTYHRQESHRIIGEFLIGERNVNRTLEQPKSDEMKTNDQNWLYQHTARCPIAMQIFLDFNAAYWCLVPHPDKTITHDISTNTGIVVRPLIPLDEQRADHLAEYLANNIPMPPYRYNFNCQQWEEQKSFFKYGIDLESTIADDVDLYDAAIVAVLPNNCSQTVKKFIESLFITHTECQLNMTGRLIHRNFLHVYPTRGHWCEDLLHRPSAIRLSEQ